MHHLNSAYRRVPLIFVVLAFFSLALLAVGCGGHSTTTAAVVSPTPTPTPTPAAAANAQIRFGDKPIRFVGDPAESILAFEVSIESISATLQSGEVQQVELPTKSNRLELSHMASKFEPFMNISIPAGTYTSLNLTLVDPAVTYVKTSWGPFDSFGSSAELVSQDFPGTQNVTITFDPPLDAQSETGVFNLDFNIANTLLLNKQNEIVSIDFTQPNAFSYVLNPIGPSDGQQHQNGELEDVTGTVLSVNGNSFVLDGGQSGEILTIGATDTTKIHDSLDNVAVFSDLPGRVIEVEGYTDPTTGALVANEIELLAGKTGASIEGVILDAGGNSVDARNILSLGHGSNSFSLLAQDGTGNGSQIADVGWTFTIHTQYLTDLSYNIDYGKCDWSGISDTMERILFPFDAQHLFPGQRVMAQTSSTLPDGDFTHFTGTSVELAQQTVTGTIDQWFSPSDNKTVAALGADFNNGGTWFTLRLHRNSFVAALSGSDTVLVYAGPGTDIELLDPNNSDLGHGSLVRVRGLMFMPFNDGGLPRTFVSVPHAGNFLTMVARRITEQQALPPCGDSSLAPCQ